MSSISVVSFPYYRTGKSVADFCRGKQHGYVHTSYEPKTDTELRLRKGQVVEDIEETAHEGWWEVGNSNSTIH